MTEPGGATVLRRPIDKGRILLTGCGKAAIPMAQAVLAVLGDRVDQGVLVTKDGHTGSFRSSRTAVHEASHPVPDIRGFKAARACVSLLENADKADLVIALISGGGSALWPYPAEGISLEEKQTVSGLLLGSGADISEMNCVRKHLSAIKGGHAARLCKAEKVVVLVVSDVIGDSLDVIASGPFHPDSSTFHDALRICEDRGILDRLPRSVTAHLQSGIGETPKPGAPFFDHVNHVLVASNRLALDAASATAVEKGFEPHILTSTLDGDVNDAAVWFCDQALARARKAKRPICCISGGEPAVTLCEKPGKGGRNQQFAALCGRILKEVEGIDVVSCGTDGTDGPTDAAGAFACGDTVSRAIAAGLDFDQLLGSHNTYFLFDTLGDLVKTGPTGTNVMDIQIALLDPR